MIKGKAFSGMITVSKYFERHADHNPLFRPEYIASETINKHIESIEGLTIHDVKKILDIINEVESREHYNGSGWLDYKIRLMGLLRLNGFEVDTQTYKGTWGEEIQILKLVIP